MDLFTVRALGMAVAIIRAENLAAALKIMSRAEFCRDATARGIGNREIGPSTAAEIELFESAGEDAHTVWLEQMPEEPRTAAKRNP